MKNEEYQIYVAIADYMRAKYPKVLYNFDMSGVYLGNMIGVKVRQKRLRCPGFAMPDLFIMEPRGKYSGLFVEIKTKNNNPIKKNGEGLKKQYDEGGAQHNQYLTIMSLYDKKYCAQFCVGFDECKEYIDWYLTTEHENKTIIIK